MSCVCDSNVKSNLLKKVLVAEFEGMAPGAEEGMVTCNMSVFQ